MKLVFNYINIITIPGYSEVTSRHQLQNFLDSSLVYHRSSILDTRLT